MSATTNLKAPNPPRGYTIVEMMVAITISLIILAALTTLFAGNSRERGQIALTNQQTENGRYALQILGDDLRDAGYLATFNPGTVAAPNAQLTVLPALPDPCATDVPTLSNAMGIAVQGYDDGANAPACLPADLRAGTDILVVRRASTCAVGAVGCDPQVAGDVYLQSSGCVAEFTAGNYYAVDSNTAALNLHRKDCVTAGLLYQYRTHIYFVANNDKPNDGIPTLKRWELGLAGQPGNIVPLVEGIENLQIEYGLDTATPTTGTPTAYTADPSSYNGCTAATTPTCVAYWRNTVAAKIHVLARNLTTTPGYTDTKSYTLGQTAAGAANTVGPFNDGYKRHVYDSAARLNNLAYRNSP
jgi:type IV pilus assembly protein PilW